MMDRETKDFLLQLKGILQEWKNINNSEEYSQQLQQIGSAVEEKQQLAAGFLLLAELIYRFERQLDELDLIKESKYTEYIEKKEFLSKLKSDVSDILHGISNTVEKETTQGNEPAQTLLGMMYASGIGVIKNTEKAAKLLEEVVQDSHSFVFFILGIIYDKKKIYEKSLFWMTKYEKSTHDALAQGYLGAYYNDGLGVEKNKKTAFYWFQKSAMQGLAASQTAMGNFYYYGETVPKDYAKARAWYEKAAAQGHINGSLNLATLYADGLGGPVDKQKAFELYKYVAEKGDINGEAALGNCYFQGIGVKQDFVEAVKWLKKCAEKKEPNAMFPLGNCYIEGIGVSKDIHKGVEWIKKAANHELPDAECALGNMYRDGVGVQQDYSEAVKWYRKAAEHGEVKAMTELGASYFSGVGVEKDYVESGKWFKKAAEQGDVEAMSTLGTFYQQGIGVSQDYQLAQKWYLKAAEKGSASAANRLGVLYEDGLGVEKNDAEAVKWCQKAVAQEYPMAQVNLGYYYCEGIYVDTNYAKAVSLFKKAAEQNEDMEAKAMGEKWLGACYYNGHGVPKNIEVAKQYVLKAKEHGDKEAQKILDKIKQEENRASSSGSDCFITTATCVSLGKPDDCYELNTFRNFRDTWLLKRFYGRLGFKVYYWLAPKLVSRINHLPNASTIYRQTWEQYLNPCLHLLEEKKYYQAMLVYITMAIRLKLKF